MNPSAIYDIETDGLGGEFVLGAVHYVGGSRTEVFRGAAGERAMVEALCAIEGEVWAHNGGRYDHLWFLDRLDDFGLRRPADVVVSGQGIVSMRIGAAEFCDSFRVFPMSLRKLTDGAKGDLSEFCTCGEACGGYCAIKRRAPRAVLRKVEEYCVGDVVELARALDYFGARAPEWGLAIGKTVGSTAWRSARAELDLPAADLPLSAWKWARAGYHGGRTECIRTESARGFACDVNSMYPYTLATTPLPVGFEKVAIGNEAARAWEKGKPGIYHATVRVPEMHLPPLPVQVDTGLAFPWGRLSGAWPRPELEYALSIGCEVERHHLAVVFERTELLFAPWVRRLFDMRMKYGKNAREGRWIKWVANSLTGKLGSRNERHSVKIWPELDELRTCECEGRDCDCGAFRPMDPLGRAWVSTAHMRKLESCAHAEWAAYLTGAARVKLHKQLAVDDRAVYCDTDSCWSETPRPQDSGAELGQWQQNPVHLEEKCAYKEFESLGPKTYRALAWDGEKWEEHVAAKGIPSPDWQKIRTGAPSPVRGLRGIRRARKGEKFFELVETTRRVTPNTGRRLPDARGSTRPTRVDQA